ncbi:transmembrane protein 18 [Phlebotomus argentipes]|uniref:transmembrane protein 18 n=1 Tax=Phlebotomus argentipes TaxID=94469 RepID=UPI002892E64F|nr:transmembrane protein 18 [Phlebotomus argentipes]
MSRTSRPRAVIVFIGWCKNRGFPLKLGVLRGKFVLWRATGGVWRKMVYENYIEVHEIRDILGFLKSIDWYDPLLMALISFHVLVTLATLLTRNHGNFQVVLFMLLILLVYFSESINEFAAHNWRTFSRQQYFDSQGLFISLVFSVPILLNIMLMVGSWLYQSTQLMAKLKTAQLREQLRKSRQNSRESLKKD